MVIAQLRNLKKQLHNKKTSLLVGSGFSKNASLKFPSWDELLHDLTYELYRFEIDHSYAIAKQHFSLRQGYGEFVNQKVKEILKNKGYLEIASEYKRTHFSEAITTYIEDRTPHLTKEDDVLYLSMGSTKEKLNEAQLALHKAMIRLPWNNIYTTNYDELLEQCIDVNRYEQLEELIIELEKERDSTLDKLTLNKKELSTAQDKLQELKTALEAEEQANQEPQIGKWDISKTDMLPMDNIEKDSQQKLIQEQIDQLRFGIMQLNDDKTDQDKVIKSRYTELAETYCLVRRSSELQLKKTKNIIKLHGSLRSFKEREKNKFEFDNDHRKQYVIAKEDYESYPRIHEAFTQLMRISLLQESFCLIGFSGTDPNFLAWVNWVQDLLKSQAQGKSDENGRYKIYLIAVGDETSQPDKALFYANHSIARISITSPEAINFLESETGQKIHPTNTKEDFYKQAFQLLTLYLGEDSPIHMDREEINSDEHRRTAWEFTAKVFNIKKEVDIGELSTAVHQVETNYHKQILPALFQRSTYRQQDLLSKQEDLIRKYPDGNQHRTLLLKLLIYAVDDLNVPLSHGLEKPYIEEALTNPETKALAENLIELDISLKPLHVHSLKFNKQLSPVNQMLQLAFSFQFGKLQKTLNLWEPAAEEILYKAGFLMIFDPNKAQQILKKFLQDRPQVSAELILYAHELQQYAHLSNNYYRNKQIDHQIEELTKFGLRNVVDNFENIERTIKLRQATDLPYGKVKHIGSLPKRFSSTTSLSDVLQYLVYLIKSGFQIQNFHTQFRSHKEWYPIVKIGFKEFPEAFLFYSLQISENDFLRQLARDYAYYEEISSILAKICNNLLINKDSLPVRYRENSFIFLSEALVAISPDYWQNQILLLWKESLKEKNNDRGISNASDLLIKKGLLLISDTKILSQILKDCLDPAQKTSDKARAISILYQLNNNPIFLSWLKKKNLSSTTQKRLEQLIDNLISDKLNLFLLVNIETALNEKQLNKIVKQLEIMPFENAEVRSLRLFHYFGSNNHIINKKIKEILLNHPRIWHTGVTETGFGKNGEAIHLTDFSKKKGSNKGITWTPLQLNNFYVKLRPALFGIQSTLLKSDIFFELVGPEFEHILMEAKEFLEQFKLQLKKQFDYTETVKLTEELIGKVKGFEDICDGISKSDERIVRSAIHALAQEIYRSKFDFKALNLLMNKILLQHEPGLELALSYLPYWLENKSRFQVLLPLLPQLISILERYQNYRTLDIEQPKIVTSCVKISILLKSANQTHPAIEFWLTLAPKSHFNSVRMASNNQ